VAISPSALTAFRSTVFLGLGSNLAHPDWQVQSAMPEIDEIPDVGLVRISSLYQTSPVGMVEQPHFVNAVVQVETTLSPHDLLRNLLDIEERHARVRKEKNGPRTLDLDILIFNEWRINDGKLTTPHPRMHERAFVLVPLLEIAPEVYIPGKGYAKDFLARLGAGGVHRLEEP
jgi:2-amino-4-hydroxy-6-hydroxymethyldihydropteridine diphosphokinase